jgi:hypothetical protein
MVLSFTPVRRSMGSDKVRTTTSWLYIPTQAQ